MAFQMLVSSAKNSSQCSLCCLRIASWYSFAAARACCSSSGSASPPHLCARALFLQYV